MSDLTRSRRYWYGRKKTETSLILREVVRCTRRIKARMTLDIFQYTIERNLDDTCKSISAVLYSIECIKNASIEVPSRSNAGLVGTSPSVINCDVSIASVRCMLKTGMCIHFVTLCTTERPHLFPSFALRLNAFVQEPFSDSR